MVWNSAQMPLYQAVKAHNQEADSERSEPQPKQQRFKPRNPAREQASSPKPREIDRDMLLILMVVFILQKEKADEGLILALLFAMIM